MRSELDSLKSEVESVRQRLTRIEKLIAVGNGQNNFTSELLGVEFHVCEQSVFEGIADSSSYRIRRSIEKLKAHGAVTVSKIEVGSAANRAGLQVGDHLLRVGTQPTESGDDINSIDECSPIDRMRFFAIRGQEVYYGYFAFDH
ncbi:PDZ domain-containing protein [Roseiconus lacunae]|uniref:PDZ domain-containing protein n=1 Tax=Roseiconus lacunae TaxID=2605694 RepID=A0ABT7PFX8_9BACT|nr:PDZ domain-containing protein [Roseiconus lacunae]MDM4015146.1 PDZ domain-containing protein [Roseiconus lacunae]